MPKAKWTIDEKIKNYESLVAKLKQQKASESVISNLKTGDAVSYEFGRGTTKKQLNGTVVAIFDSHFGKTVAIHHGEGKDIALHKVPAAAIRP